MRRVALLVLTILGCSAGGDKSTPASTDAGTAANTSAGDPNVLAGTFQVKLASGAASFIGKVYDGPALGEVVWEPKQADGDCQLFTPRVPFCSTPCGGSGACVENETCKAYPVSKSVGGVTVTGLTTTSGAASLAMSPIVNSYQPTGGAALAYPPFAEGAAIHLEAEGGAYAHFAIDAKGIAPLALTGTSLAVNKGTAVTLAWTPPGDPSLTKIGVKLDLSHHGGSKGKIECTTADDGELVLSSEIVSALLDLGVAGFPTVIVTRRATGSAVIAPGRVDLALTAEVEQAVVVDGLNSCNDTSQCPTGQTCQSDLTCKGDT